MAYKILSGPLMNLFGRGAGYGASATGPASSASVASGFPLSNAYDGRPSRPVKLAAASTGFYFTFPNNLVTNGDFEQSALTGWTASSAALASEAGAGNFHKGSRSLKVTGSTSNGHAYQDVTVLAGETLQLWAAAKSDGTNDASVVVNCLETNKAVSTAGTWTTVDTPAMLKTGNTMTAFTPVTFTVPSHSELGKSTATLRIKLVVEINTQVAYFDEVLLVPGINFCGVFGHNLEARASFTLATGATNYWHGSGGWSVDFGDPATSEFLRQTPYISKTTLTYDPFPAVFFYPGGSYGGFSTRYAPYIGELVVGQMKTLDPCPDYPVGIEYVYPQSRMETARGDQWVMNRMRYPRRKVTMSFAYFSDTEYQTARDEIYNMSEGGAYPIILVPEDTDSGEAIYGRVQPGVTFIRNNYITRTAEFVVQEEPLPVMS